MAGRSDLAKMLSMKMFFDAGSLVLENVSPAFIEANPSVLIFDERILAYRSQAFHYRTIVLAAQKMGVSLQDDAKAYTVLDLSFKSPITPREHQSNALKCWIETGKSGVVSLPTGAGKTILSLMAIVAAKRSTLILVPTIDLLNQWHGILCQNIQGSAVGRLGGGYKDIQPITVSTYDSARLHIDTLGNQFGLLICDECHHLPAATNQITAKSCLAPFRLGVSATLDRNDEGEVLLYELLGPLVYTASISSMAGGVLAPYDVVTVEVSLTQKEKELYQHHRSIYTHFLKASGINMSSPDGWQQFIIRSSRSQQGRLAFQAYLKQKNLAQAAEGKLSALWNILITHTKEQILIFTQTNDLAYEIGQMFFLPVLTHKSSTTERKALLEAFREKRLQVLVTSKVLNEGVDLPSASIGVVVSGSGGVREHVQRLGRILRQEKGKRATFYEIVTKDTSEEYLKTRRRNHDAYAGSY